MFMKVWMCVNKPVRQVASLPSVIVMEQDKRSSNMFKHRTFIDQTDKCKTKTNFIIPRRDDQNRDVSNTHL